MKRTETTDRTSWFMGLCLLSIGVLANRVEAQQIDDTAADSTSSEEPSSHTDHTQTSQALPALEEHQTIRPCFPKCRTGYLCHQGQCIARCNPPCASQERCTPSGECTSLDPVAAKSPEPSQGQLGHIHSGFFLRLSLGFGYSRTKGEATYDENSDSIEYILYDGNLNYVYSGFSGFFAFDIGGAVIENLILHARLSDVVCMEPTVHVKGEDLGELEDVSLSFMTYGAGVTYYFMPLNIYGTFVMGASRAIAKRIYRDIEREKRFASGWGFTLEVDIGKEWWVGSEWGLGVAGRFSVPIIPSYEKSGVEEQLYTLAFGILFSATYN